MAMKTNNKEVREEIKNSGYTYYEVAELLGISENTFFRRLRKELSEEDKQKIIEVIRTRG